MFSAIAHAVANKRTAWIILAVWIVAVGLSRVAPQPKSSSQQQDFLPSTDDSIVASHLASDPAKFPHSGTRQQLPLIVIFRNDAGLTADNIQRAKVVSDYFNNRQQRPPLAGGVTSIFTADNAQPGQPLPSDPRFVSSDGKTLTLTALFDFANDTRLGDQVRQANDFIRKTASGSPGLQTGVSGIAAQLADSTQAFKNLNGSLTLISVVLVIVLLALIYRAPFLIFAVLVSIGFAYTLSAGLFGAIARGLGLVVNPQSTSLAIVLILGAGTDYALFIISRYREELRQNESKYVAMWHTMTNVGEAIASSALIVVATLLLLILGSLKFFSNLGPSAALAIACMLIAGLTLLPAALVLMGRNAFWPFRPRFGEAHAEDSGAWNAVGRAVVAQPRLVFGVTTALFVALALFTIGLKQRYDFVSNFPPSYASRQGQQLLEKAGPQDVGKLAPVQVFVSSADPILNHFDQLVAITNALQQTAGVQSVTGFGGQGRASAAAVQVADQTLPPSQRAIAADGRTAQLTATLNRDPYQTAAMDLIGPIRRNARAPVSGSGLRINVGGETAVQADTRSDIARDELLIGPIIFVVIGLILAALLRSLVAPLYLLATTALSFMATLGLTALVFQKGVGESGIQDFVPPFMAIFLIALGADYNVFIMSRVREETGRIGLHDGVQKAIARTGGVITSAGLILAGTFAVLLVLPLSFLKQIGFSVAAGVLLDTFVVRALLVPSIVLLLGRWNWWPGRAARKDEALAAGLASGD